MKNMVKRIMYIMFLLSYSLYGQTTFYVDYTNGNDANNGTSIETAWKTSGKVYNYGWLTGYSPGDTIKFKRGETFITQTWNNSLSFENQDGTASNYIVVSAYGTGAKPIITTRDTIDNWSLESTWTDNGSNVWYGTFSNFGARIWTNGSEVTAVETLAEVVNDTTWHISGDNKYIYATSNPALYYSSIEYTGRDIGRALYIDGCSYIKFEYLDIRGGGTGNVQLLNSSNIIFDSCAVGLYAPVHGFYINNVDTLEIAYCDVNAGDSTFNDWYGFNNTQDGISFRDNCDSAIVHHNTVTDFHHVSLSFDQSLNGQPNRRIHFYNNTATRPNGDYGRGFLYNVSATLQSTRDSCNAFFYNNYFYDFGVNSQISGSNITFYNNIIDVVRGEAYVPGGGTGMQIYPYTGTPANNNYIIHNSISNAADAGINIGWTSADVKYNIISNNIVYNNDTVNGYQFYYAADPGSFDNNTIQNNIFYKFGTTNVIFYEPGANAMTVAEFNTATGTNSDVMSDNIQLDPLLTNYQPQLTSPAIEAGTPISWITTDYAGNTRDATTPDIGAFEYRFSRGPVKSLSTSSPIIINGKIINL